MKAKDIKLFDKTIHQVKHLTSKIYKQRKELDEDITELKEVVGELYELFDNLYGEDGK